MVATRGKDYYGGLFWLSLVSFIVPVFVAVAAFQAAKAPYTKPTPNPDPSGVDHALWDYLLKQYVENGLVDYEGMRKDHLFTTYLGQLGRAKPEALASDDARLALYCNAYNAFVVNGVINHDISTSVMDYEGETGFFDLEEHILGGETMSLNHLEHEVIREDFEEPRIHMALVCAAISCPAIRREAYLGDGLDRQLEDQAIQFANNKDHVSYESAMNRVRLNPILKWYGEDFDAVGGYHAFLADRVRDEALAEALRKAADGQVETVFTEYDWSLNSQRSAEKEGGMRSTSFGSGSIPNE